MAIAILTSEEEFLEFEEMFFTEIGAGTQVRFPLSTIVCPEKDLVVEQVTDRLEVTGKIVYLSDAGEKRDYYAIVEVGGIHTPLIVPVDQLELVPCE